MDMKEYLKKRGFDDEIIKEWHLEPEANYVLISYFDTNGNYTSVCSDPTILTALVAAKTAYGNSAGDTADCNGAAAAWAACSQLKVSDAYFCVDYTGAKKTIATRSTCVAAWAATVCP